MDEYESLSHTKWDCPRGLHSQVPPKNDLWRIAPTSTRRGVPQAGAAEKESRIEVFFDKSPCEANL
jgi:hypothetical protein